jgi:perosamine synthetase
MIDLPEAVRDLVGRLRDLDESALPTFEDAAAAAFGSTYAVAMSSGTAALHCGLAAVGVTRGDEVLVPALSVVMSVAPVLYLGATPIFVDCQPECIDFDYDDLSSKVSARTKAVMPVHLWGCAYNMSRLVHFAKNHHLAIVEDACQAHGSVWDGRRLGTHGDIGCFSMQEGKLISVGEGGFILTSDAELAAACRGYRNHWAYPGHPDRSYARVGWNYRLTRLQAILATEQVRRFEGILAERRRQAQMLLTELREIDELEPYHYANSERPNFHQVVLLLHNDYAGWNLARVLALRGVMNSVGTFGLRPAPDREIFRSHAEDDRAVAAPNSHGLLARAMALILDKGKSDEELFRIARTIKQTMEELRNGNGSISNALC